MNPFRSNEVNGSARIWRDISIFRASLGTLSSILYSIENSCSLDYCLMRSKEIGVLGFIR
jgi:hypothetical protein